MLQVLSFKWLGPAHLPDGAAAPPLRDEGLVRDEDHGALLDRHRHPLRARASRSSTSTTCPSSVHIREGDSSTARRGPAGRRPNGCASRGDEVVVVDRALGERGRPVAARRRRAAREVARACRARRPLVVAARQRGIPVWSEVELGYRLLAPTARGSSASPGRTGRRRPASCSARSSAPPGATLRSPGTSGRRSSSVRSAEWVVCELSSLPARGRARVRLRGRGAAQPRAGPPRPARHASTPTATPKLRIFERARAAVVPRGFASGKSLAGDSRVPARRRAAGGAAASAGGTTARTQPPRPPRRGRSASATRRSPRRCGRSRGCRIGSSSSASRNGVRYVNDSKATNVAAALRALAAYADEPVHLILGGSLKGEELRSAGGGDRPERALDPPDRRGGAGRWRLPRPPVSRSSTATLARAVDHAAALAASGRGRSCSARPAPATTSSRTSSAGARHSGSSQRARNFPSPREGDRWSEAGRARVEDPDPRHARAGRLRDRDASTAPPPRRRRSAARTRTTTSSGRACTRSSGSS